MGKKMMAALSMAALSTTLLFGSPISAQAAGEAAVNVSATFNAKKPSQASRVTLGGNVAQWGADATFVNGLQQALLGEAVFTITVPEGVSPGETFTIDASNGAVFLGKTSPVVDAGGNVVATVEKTATQLVFTFTDYVKVASNVQVTYTQSVGYDSTLEGGFKPRTDYMLTWKGAGGLVEIPLSTSDHFNTVKTLQSGWVDNVVQSSYTSSKSSGTDPTVVDLAVTGGVFDCSTVTVAAATWEGTSITGQSVLPGATVDCKDATLTISGQVSADQTLFVSVATEGIVTGGERTPVKVTATEGDFTVSETPVAPVSEATASGEVRYVHPTLSKTILEDRSGFLLTVTNPSTDALVPAGTYRDTTTAAGVTVPVTFGTPSLGEVSGTAWTVPALAPGESATVVVTVDPAFVEPGDVQVDNTLCADDGDCVSAALVPDPAPAVETPTVAPATPGQDAAVVPVGASTGGGVESSSGWGVLGLLGSMVGAAVLKRKK